MKPKRCKLYRIRSDVKLFASIAFLVIDGSIEDLEGREFGRIKLEPNEPVLLIDRYYSTSWYVCLMRNKIVVVNKLDLCDGKERR